MQTVGQLGRSTPPGVHPADKDGVSSRRNACASALLPSQRPEGGSCRPRRPTLTNSESVWAVIHALGLEKVAESEPVAEAPGHPDVVAGQVRVESEWAGAVLPWGRRSSIWVWGWGIRSQVILSLATRCHLQSPGATWRHLQSPGAT